MTALAMIQDSHPSDRPGSQRLQNRIGLMTLSVCGRGDKEKNRGLFKSTVVGETVISDAQGGLLSCCLEIHHPGLTLCFLQPTLALGDSVRIGSRGNMCLKLYM